MQQRVPFSVYVSGGALILGALSVALLPPVLFGGFPPWIGEAAIRPVAVLSFGAVAFGALGALANALPGQRDRWAWAMSAVAILLGWIVWRVTHPTHPEL